MTKPIDWRLAHRAGRQEREAAVRVSTKPQRRYFSTEERALHEKLPWPAVYQTDRASLSTIASKQAQSASRNRRRVVPMTLPTISILGDDQ